MTFKQLFTKFFWLSGSNLLGMLASFGVVLVIVDVYGAEGLGRISLVFAVLQYCVLFSGSGIENYAIREVSAKRQALEQMVTSLFVIRFLSGLIVYAVLLLFVQVVPGFKEQESLFFIMSLTLFIIPFRTAWVAQAQHKSHVLGFFNLGIDLSFLLGVLASTLLTTPLETVTWIKIITEALVTGILLYWMNQRFGSLQQVLPWVQLRALVHQSWHFTVFPLLRGAALGSDLILLSLFVTTIELGLYSGASRIFFVLLSLTAAYIVIIFPRLSELSSESLTSSRLELIHFYRIMMPLAFIGALVLIQLSEFVLVLLFGEEFVVASDALQMLTIAFIANFAGRHYRQMLLVADKQKYDLAIVFFSTVVHIVAKLLLIPVMGINGAALGTAIGEIIMFIVYIIVSSHLFKKGFL